MPPFGLAVVRHKGVCRGVHTQFSVLELEQREPNDDCEHALAYSAPLRQGKKEGVHNVHTLGFGSGRTGGGLGRIAEVFGGVAETQGLESGSSPTSGTCFPCSGACKL